MWSRGMPALIAMFLGYVLFVPKNGKLPEKAAFFLAFTSILLAAQFRSKRFAEYFPPFAILFAAFAWNAFTAPKAVELPDEFQRELDPYLDVDKPTEKQAWMQAARASAVWIIGIALCVFWVYNLIGLHKFGFDEPGMIDNISSNEPNDKYRRSMEWATGLDETGADGLVPVSTLGDDAFQLDERHQALVGQRSGECFALGDRVKVELVEADPVQGTLLFRLESHEPGKGAELARAAWKKAGPRRGGERFRRPAKPHRRR